MRGESKALTSLTPKTLVFLVLFVTDLDPKTGESFVVSQY